MRKLIITHLIVMLITSFALAPINANATPSANDAEIVNYVPISHQLLAISAGAVLGVVVFNTLSYPMGSAPFATAPMAITYTSATTVSSRFLAAMIGATAAIASNYIYKAVIHK